MSSEESLMPDDDVVIRFENVSKRYKRTFGGLRHLVQDGVDRIMGRNDGGPPEERYLWALKDVSFDVRRGEILGIIGLNGAGKSTILKLASRITHPTGGDIEVKGRVGALIEVGAGFHPELTGRENVYLNGSILGMTRAEIEDKYESIVDFAELDGFMDMPVKRYSSGMYVRLGFAVAAHLDPYIFLIDEVLAVGDTGFRAKCINEISRLKDSGSTIVLVSHNLHDIANYSDRALWLDNGYLRKIGKPTDIVDSYLYFIKELKNNPAADTVQGDTIGLIEINNICLTDSNGNDMDSFNSGDEAFVNIEYTAKEEVLNPVVGIAFHDVHGQYIGTLTTAFDDVRLGSVVGHNKIVFMLNPIIFLKGAYSLTIYIRDESNMNWLCVKERALTLIVTGAGISERKIGGFINFPHKWIIDGEMK